MKALVTGGAGFVGANLSRSLLTGGHDVTVAVRPDGDRWRLADIADEISVLPIDLEDAASLQETVVSERPDVIFHLAAHGAYSWQQDLSKMLAVNMRATQALLDAAVTLDARLIHAGSSSEYGYKDHPPQETEITRPNSHYAVTKLGATNLCQLAADRHGICAVTLRLYSIYGPWEEPGRLMPTLVKAAQAGDWPPLVDPSIARDFVWIEDACEAFIRAATAELTEPGAVFNIASGVQTTLADLVEVAADVFMVNAPPEWGTMPQRRWDTSVWVGAPEGARRDLGWSVDTALRVGLVRFGEWLEQHPEAAARYA
jgi:nucleoside-diphosphate-sugar epimerase